MRYQSQIYALSTIFTFRFFMIIFSSNNKWPDHYNSLKYTMTASILFFIKSFIVTTLSVENTSSINIYNEIREICSNHSAPEANEVQWTDFEYMYVPSLFFASVPQNYFPAAHYNLPKILTAHLKISPYEKEMINVTWP